MKKLLVLACVLALGLVTAQALAGFSFSTPTVKDVGKTVANNVGSQAIEDDINKKLSKNCAFTDSTTTSKITCNTNDMVNTINKNKSALETFGLANVYTNIVVHGSSSTISDRRTYLNNIFCSGQYWWRCYVTQQTDNTNTFEVSVDVKGNL